MIILRASTPGDESSPRMKTWPASKFGQHYHPWKLMLTIVRMMIIVRMMMTMGMMIIDDDHDNTWSLKQIWSTLSPADELSLAGNPQSLPSQLA